MRTEQYRLIRFYTIAVTLAVILLVSFLRFRERDILFARRVFSGLAAGKMSAARMIDWPDFNALGANVGVSYSALADAKERLDYENFFIKSFSANFNKAGGRMKEFSNWRVYRQDTLKTVIASDYKKQDNVLLLTVTRDGRLKLIAMEWERKNASQ